MITYINSGKIDEGISILIEEDWKRADSNMELRIGLGMLDCSASKLVILRNDEDNKIEETVRDANKIAKSGKDKFIHGFEKLVELEKKGPDIFKLKYTTAEVKQRYDLMIDSLDKMEKTLLAGDAITALSIKENEFDPHLLELQGTVLEEAEEFADAIVENSEKTFTQFTAKIVKVSIILTIITVFVGIAYSFIVSRVVSKPIIKLKNSAIEIGKGEFDKKIEVKSKDEIGQLADSLNQMSMNFKNLLYSISQSAERYKNLIENCTAIIYQLDKERFFVGTNSSMLKKLSFLPEELKKMRVEDIVPANKREAMVKHIQKTIETGQDSIETIFITKNEEELYVEINANALYDSEGNLIETRAFAHDMTERKKIEKTEKQKKGLQLLASQIIAVQEDEKKRISRELHDEAGQALVAMNINLELMEKQIPLNLSKIRERLVDTKNILVKALKEIRSLSFELRIPLLEYFGILVAVREYSKRFSKRSNINVKVHAKNIVGRFPFEIEVLLYRCTQEALTNVAKHSEAKNVKIDLIKENGNLRMNIKDDGKGFNAMQYLEENINISSIGLFGMRERIALMDGKLRVHSKKNEGTVLEILVPYNIDIRKNKYSTLNKT
ncbi:MAG: HAMP domain-containing protein [Candidatus Scalinduaceae bacterium]